MVKLLIAAMLLTAACGGPALDPAAVVGTWEGRTALTDEHFPSAMDAEARIVANGDGTLHLAGVCAMGDGPTIATIDNEMRVEPFDCPTFPLATMCDSISLSDFGLRNCYETHIDGGRVSLDAAGALTITMTGTRSSCTETYPYTLRFSGSKG